MTSYLNKKFVYVIFLLGLSILLGSSFFAYRNIQDLLKANAWVIHTHEVIGKTKEILLSVLDAEMQEQSYFNSGSDVYLEGYQAALLDTKNKADQLRILVKNNLEQQQRLEKIYTYLTKHTELFRNITTVYKTKGKAAAANLMSSTEPEQFLREIKRIVNEISNTEMNLLQVRNAKMVHDSHESNIMMIIVGALTCFLLLQSLFLLNFQEKKHLEEQVDINRELAEKNKKIEEASRLKSEFLANMSHELRTPLNAIIGFSELMKAHQVGPITIEQEDFLVDILGSAKHLLQLITDVLDLSKLEAGKIEFYAEEVNLPRLVQEVVDVLQPLVTKKKIHLTTEIDNAVTTVYIDPSRFKQVLYGYLSNALKFTPELGTVKIRIKNDEEGMFRLEVEDNGIGIKPEDIKKLFFAFEQLDASTVKKYAGTGLGLALTKNIVEAQGGKVGVTSSIGVGSIFSVLLPINQLDSNSARRKTKQQMQTVLVIEDNQSDMEWIVNILSSRDFAIETAATGEKAVSHCENHPFDLIVMDLALSDMNSSELIKKIRSTANVDTPIVVTLAAEAQGVVLKKMSNYNQQLLTELNKLTEKS